MTKMLFKRKSNIHIPFAPRVDDGRVWVDKTEAKPRKNRISVQKASKTQIPDIKYVSCKYCEIMSEPVDIRQVKKVVLGRECWQGQCQACSHVETTYIENSKVKSK